MSEVSLEDVGVAESVLQRLVNERKSLEVGVQVLQTYRAVKAQLESATGELRTVQNNVIEAKRELQSVDQQKMKALQAVDEQVTEYRERMLHRVDSEIEGLEKKIVELESTYQEMDGMYNSDKVLFEGEIERLQADITKKSAELAKLQADHAVLAEAIVSAASFLSKSR